MKRSLKVLSAASLVLAVAFPVSNQAATATDVFTVTLTVVGTCVIVATPLEFGTSSGNVATNIDATSTLNVTCTTGTPYQVGLSAGNGTGATYAARKLTNAANTANYSLFTDAARTTVWNETTQRASGVGDATAQTITVYGRVFAPQTLITGAYADAITATVTF